MNKFMCKIKFFNKNKNKKINIETSYELDCKMYNGIYFKSKEDWLRNDTTFFREVRCKIYPINI
jgi:hypothetical protein